MSTTDLTQPNPSGLCLCGCGQPVKRAKNAVPDLGIKKGDYRLYVVGHAGRKSPVDFIETEDTHCWVWQHRINSDGYGMSRDKRGENAGAHRVYYELMVDDIPEGLTLDHLCKNRACVNPGHLEAVTRTENIRRSACTTLTREQARQAAINEEGLSADAWAKRFGVKAPTIYSIWKGKTWKDVGTEGQKAVAYLRVSTEEQADSGLGLAAQRAAVVAEAERRGWVLEIVEDAGYTGRNMRRPSLIETLDRLDRGDYQTLICAKLDRLSRSLVDFAGLMERSRKNGWGLVCLDIGVDTASAQGKMVASIFATFAEFESDLIGERTKAALAAKKRQGFKLGRPVTVAPEPVEVIGKLRRGGLSYGAISEWLNHTDHRPAKGGRWWPETVRQIDQREAA